MIYEDQPDQQFINETVILNSKTGKSAFIRGIFRRLDTLFLFLIFTILPIAISLFLIYMIYLIFESQIIGFLIFSILSIAVILYTGYFYRRYAFDLIAINYQNLVKSEKQITTEVSRGGILYQKESGLPTTQSTA